MTTAIQRSFSGGELAPGLYARADQSKYQSGLKTCRNFQVQRFGGVQNRPGSKLIYETKGSGSVRLIKFVFNASQTYVLEFGNLYMRVIRNGAMLETSPGVPYEIVTPYVTADLLTLQYVQSADVVTIVHPNYPPYELKRTGHMAWTLAPVSFLPSIAAPQGVTGTGTAGALTIKYMVSAVSSGTLEESLPGSGYGATVFAATNANPCAITTSAPHGYVTGDQVTFYVVNGMTQLNGNTYTITVTGLNTFTLNGVDSTGYGAFTGGGGVRTIYFALSSIASPTIANPITLTWGAVSGAKNYYVYKEVNGVFGFIGIAGTAKFVDGGITPDQSDNPAEYPILFGSAGNYPSTATYFQQRMCFANTNNATEKAWFSQVGNFHNFSTMTPVQDDDAVIFTLAGRQVNEVLHLIEIGGKLSALTGGGEFVIQGDTDGVVKPTAINVQQQGYHGAGDPSPIAIGNTAIYLQARGSIVRDYRYDINADGYQGDDLTTFSAHLFDGQTIVDWDYAEIPQSIVWAIRADGVMLGLTYLREQQVIAWHRHDTLGSYERIVSIPEGTEDAVYVVVNRTIGGVTKRFIERFASRRVTNVAIDAFFVDCGLSYDGRNVSATTMTLTGSGWTVDDVLTLTASASFFVAGDVDNSIFLTIGTAKLEARIIAYTSGTVVSVRAQRDVPATFQGVATAVWSRAVDDVGGLSHLEGQTVSILADGNVEPQQVVTGGTVHLTRPYTIIHVGLPYVSQLESLDLENVQSETLTDKKKLVKKVTVLLESSRGMYAGTDFDHLYEAKFRTTENYGDPTLLQTGAVEVGLDSTWNNNGHWCLQQADPLPLAVLAVAPTGDVGGA
jgi:hypothetical protein